MIIVSGGGADWGEPRIGEQVDRHRVRSAKHAPWRVDVPVDHRRSMELAKRTRYTLL